MKKSHMLLLAMATATGLAGCAGSGESQELSRKNVEYQCGPGGEQPLNVQYTFRGDEAVSARVIYLNQAVEMVRVTTGNADMVGNTFRGGGHTWTTGKFDRDDVEDVDGDMLTQDAAVGAAQGTTAAAASTGQSGAIGTVLLQDCRVS
jgi:membrane-bound inhibitor of C-type lysozyme